MARVEFPDSFVALTGGQRELQTSARNYRELTTELLTKWPGLADILERSAVAIDGQIIQDAFLEPIGEDAEVFFMARIEGG